MCHLEIEAKATVGIGIGVVAVFAVVATFITQEAVHRIPEVRVVKRKYSARGDLRNDMMS